MRIIGMLACLLLATAEIAVGQQEESPYSPPDDLGYRTADIYSEGTRMSAELYWLKSSGDARLPTILMCHGWGGEARHLRPDAEVFARAGYLVVTFDYRGWGPSDARLVLTGPKPDGEGATFQGEVREVREIVDPIDQTTDLLNAIHWLNGETRCDADRIGLWGSSFSGGHVVYAAARDRRVKALVSQVPSLDGRWAVQSDAMRDATYRQGTARTRGELGYPEPGARVMGNLRGAPVLEKMMHYAPVEDVERAGDCAMLFILAENEELFDNRDHGILAHERASGPKKLVIVPEIAHYGIYNEARAEAQQLAIDWFDIHLRGESVEE